MSRHRGAKRSRRYGLSGIISLLSLTYLLFVERWPYHQESSDHYDRLSSLLDVSVLQSGRLIPLCSTIDFQPIWVYLRTPPLLFRRWPPQSNYRPCNVHALSFAQSTCEEIMSFRVVFQGWILDDSKAIMKQSSFAALQSFVFSHLSYTKTSNFHYKDIVKVHRVLPSNRLISASSRRIQFHWVHVGDSGAIVTPFMRVATYATRNFATLGLLELQPPFTGLSI